MGNIPFNNCTSPCNEKSKSNEEINLNNEEVIIYNSEFCVQICPKCHINFTKKSKIGVADCSHAFHENCLKQIIINNEKCPECNSLIKSMIKSEIYGYI